MLHPSGFHQAIIMHLACAERAPLQVEYKKLVVLAALNFLQHLGQLKDKPLKDRASKEVQALPDLKAEPGQPATLSERVFHAFAQQNMPVYKPLTLPVTSADLSCPGLSLLHSPFLPRPARLRHAAFHNQHEVDKRGL